jgi:hypothetical protein
MRVTLKKQLEAFEKGIYLDSDGKEDSGCYNFYDWFCKDTALKAKADKLFKQAKRWVKFRNTDTEKVYVFLKTTVQFGPLYDDFRICDIETSDVIWTITPKCGHSGKSEVWGRQNDFNGPITVGQNMNEIYKQAF